MTKPAATVERPRLVVNDRSVDLLPAQREFMDLKGCRYPGFVGGLGSSKSFALNVRMLRNCFLNPGMMGAYLCLTYPLLRDAIIPLMRQVLQMHGLVEGTDWTFTKSEMTLKLWCACDSSGAPATVLFREVQHLERMIALNLAWALMDEADSMSEEAHRRVDERVRDDRSQTLEVAVGTSPEGLTHLYDSYIVNARKRAAAATVLDDKGRAADEQWKFVRGSTRDNKYLAPGYVDSLLSRYPEHLVNSYIDGYWVPMFEGLCFKFSEAEHVSSDAEYSPFLPIRMGWDFNVNPMSVSLNHYHKGKLWTFGEIVLNSSHTDEVCREFLGDYMDHEAGVTIYGDAGGRSRSTKGRWTDYDIIREQLRDMPNYVEQVPRANCSQRDGINSLNGLLKNGHGVISYSVHPSCSETIKSLITTAYADNGGIDKGPDAYEHLSDGLRYMAWEIAPVSKQERLGAPKSKRTAQGLRVKQAVA